MNFTALDAVANALLFEGYILYPYRPSSLKNRQRWNFGTLYPRAFAEAQAPPERWQFRTEVLLEASPTTQLSARVRFLQLFAAGDTDSDGWQEGFARSRAVEDLSLAELLGGIDRTFNLSELCAEERASAPPTFAEEPRIGRLTIHAHLLREGLHKLHIQFANESQAPAISLAPQKVHAVAFTSAHLMLGVEHGAFVSLLEPQPEHAADAAACVQDGVFPVLAGDAGDRSRMLCSPIILYDYPVVAPESPGDFFDGTEMDEMLALRVLTLTDDEKAEMRRGDRHARAILERTETLPAEQLARVHGTLRGLRRITQPASQASTDGSIDLFVQPFDPFAEYPSLTSVRVFGIELRTGDRVRLWPQKKADIMDLAMEGKVALIEAIEQDLDNNVQFAVVLEDDPGRDLGLLRQAGHRFFFSPDEVEPMGLEAS